MFTCAMAAYKIVSILVTVCPTVTSVRSNNGSALLAGMTLYGSEKVVKGVEIGGPSEGRFCHTMTKMENINGGV